MWDNMLIVCDPSTYQMMYNQLYAIVMDKWHSHLMKLVTNNFNYTVGVKQYTAIQYNMWPGLRKSTMQVQKIADFFRLYSIITYELFIQTQ